ncbi:MAG: purine-nucleoside phosphorylase [Oscillospiraceae bacterium]|nr:purine-nucleoside phosphorylase [Oscillospiraceae bacterium]
MSMKILIDDTVQYIQGKTDFKPEIGIVLGSGLGSFADKLENPVYIDYGDIPGFPVSTVQGHKGRFVLGERLGRKIIAMQGRFHFYEGYDQDFLTMPIRVMKKLGVEKLLLTNAAGGVNTSFPVGSLMMITDHINYSGKNPLFGANLDEFGPRFPDMGDVYTKDLRVKLKAAANEAGIPLQEGVYMIYPGPSYETPAEIRMARTLGADAVGMSTVPEAIVARHAGIQVIGVSCISNMAAGILDEPLSHADVVEVTARAHNDFVALLEVILEKVF